MDDAPYLPRRKLIAAALLLPGAEIVAGPAQAGATTYGHTPKAAVNYRDAPNAGHACSGCRFFIRPAEAGANGHCHIVAGSISPHGWCIVWSPKA